VINMAFYDEVKTSSGAYKYYVNGQWLESKSGKTQAIMNPSTNEPVYHVQGVSNSIVPRAHVRCSFRQPSVQMNVSKSSAMAHQTRIGFMHAWWPVPSVPPMLG